MPRTDTDRTAAYNNCEGRPNFLNRPGTRLNPRQTQPVPRIAVRLLGWFLLIALLPLAAVLTRVWAANDRALRRAVVENVKALADAKAQRIEAYAAERRADAVLLARAEPLRRLLGELSAAARERGADSPAARDAEARLRPFLADWARDTGYADLFAFSPGGAPLTAARGGRDSAKSQHLGRAVRLAAMLLSAEFSDFEATPNGPAAYIAAPVLSADTGRLAGVVALQVSGREAAGVVNDHTGLGESGETVVTAVSAGRPLFVTPTRHDPRAEFRQDAGPDEPPSPGLRAALGERGSGTALDYRGQETVAAWRYLPDLRWGVTVKIDTEEAFEDVHRQRRVVAVLGVTTFFLVVLLALVLSRTVTQPLLELTEAVRRISGGDLRHRVRVKARDEIGELADAFNKMTEDINNLYATLENRVRVRTHELEQSNAQLDAARLEAESANRAKSQFLANMSHEIRTPLTAVGGFSELLIDSPLTAQQRDFAQIIRTSGQALLALVDDILDFSKIEAGQLTLESHPFDLRECAESAADLFALAAAEKGLDLACVFEPGAPRRVVGDPLRLRQVLVNLLGNAVKFTERGEVVLTVGPAEAHEGHGRGDPDGRCALHLAVRDTGVGIPADRHDRLFRSFSQVDASMSRRYGGTGLGLAISKRLTEMMGGSIWVDSTPGVGSSFHFTLSVGLVEGARERHGPRPLEGRRVLVVDDHPSGRLAAARLLAEWGAEAVPAGGPGEVADALRGGAAFDAALIDAHLPAGAGVQLARAVRDDLAPKLPLVAVCNVGRRLAAADEGLFAARLTRPVKQQTLWEALAVALGLDRPGGDDLPDAPATPAVPLRVLLAEDNAVSRKLMLTVLERLGYGATTAGDGAEVLAALERSAFDVVLMDVQMPGIDGLEAARRITQRYGAGRPRVVALTAHASADDRAQCLAAGMDDYLTKPVQPAALRAALERCASGAAAHADDWTTPADGPPALARLDGPTRAAALRELAGLFRAESADLLAALRRAVIDGDAAALSQAAHSLKGASANIGAEELAGRCGELDARGRAGEAAGLGELIDEAERLAERAWRDLEAAAGRAGG